MHPSPPHEPESEPAAWRAPRVWGVGEDPLTWSIPLVHLFGLPLRLHVLTPLWVGAEMVAWVPRDAMGLIHVSAAVTSLVVLGAAREVCRAMLARRLTGESGDVILWPLGGLSPSAVQPRRPLQPFLTECGGLLFGAVMLPVLGWCVLASGAGWGSLAIDPISPRFMAGGLRSHFQVWAWWAYFANALLLVTNALLPMAPMDAGRLLSHVRGRAVGSMLATRVGLLTALLVFAAGAGLGEVRLLALGAFGALATHLQQRRREFLLANFERLDEESPAMENLPLISTPPLSSCQLDAVLAKISLLGLEALDESEREVLRRETERRRSR